MATDSSPTYVGDEFQGVAGTDVTLALLAQHVGNLEPVEDGYAFLVDGDSRALVCPSRAIRTSSIVAFAPLASTSWSVGAVGERDVVLMVITDLLSDLDKSMELLIW